MKRLPVILMLPVLLGCGRLLPPDPLTVLTFNIKYDNQNDEAHPWKPRLHQTAATLDFFKVDAAGFQEVLPHQMEDLAAALPLYSWTGEGRDGSGQGEYSPIFYRSDRLYAMESGTFWLAPDTGRATGPAWDAACPRIATWGHFRDLKNQSQCWIINTHWDHVGQEARLESAALIGRFVSQRCGNEAVVVMGDFNCTAQNSALISLMQGGSLEDSRLLSETGHYGALDTFNGFGANQAGDEAIDYILVKGMKNIRRHGTISDRWDSVHTSDHNAVLAEVIY